MFLPWESDVLCIFVGKTSKTILAGTEKAHSLILNGGGRFGGSHAQREREKKKKSPPHSALLVRPYSLLGLQLSLSLSSRRRPHTQELTGLGGTMSAFSLGSSCVAFRLWPRCFFVLAKPFFPLVARSRGLVLLFSPLYGRGYRSSPGAGRCLRDVRREFGNGMRSDEAGNGEILEGVNHPLRFFGVLKLSD